MINISKTMYLLIFVVLGILFQLIIHALVEIWYLNLLINDFQNYSLGMSFAQWLVIHYVSMLIFLAIGIGSGYLIGSYMWVEPSIRKDDKL